MMYHVKPLTSWLWILVSANYRKVVVNIDNAMVVGEPQTTAAAMKNMQQSHKWAVVVTWPIIGDVLQPAAIR